MTFYAYELDGVCPAYGWQAGPSGNTEVQTKRNQHERRNAIGDEARHHFNLPFANIRRLDYLQYLKSVHMVMYAMTHSFLVKDWLDWQVVNGALGVAPSGTSPIQLQKIYGIYVNDVLLASRARDITKPMAGAVIYENTGSGPVVKPGTLSTTTGIFVPDDPWAEDADLTWTGEFRVPVRFNNDYMPMTIDNASGGQHVVNGAVELIEVYGE